MVREQDHINEMLEIKRQIYLTDSWKRKKDLERALSRKEAEWFRYKKLKNQGQNLNK